jgi:hypothetical protein
MKPSTQVEIKDNYLSFVSQLNHSEKVNEIANLENQGYLVSGIIGALIGASETQVDLNNEDYTRAYLATIEVISTNNRVD